MSPRPPALRLYAAATAVLSPLAPLWLRRRAKGGKEDPERLGERLGNASAIRPEGPLIWLHGASVGESLSHLPLVERLRRERPDLTVLVTSGTVTSADVLRRRLPDGVIHQFAPLDTPAAARRFMHHWRPGLGIIVESELWPNLLMIAKAEGVKLALLGARISEDSAKGWNRAPRSAGALLGLFDLILAQDERARAWLEGHGGLVSGELDLKHAAAPLPVDDAALADFKARLGRRPAIVAAGTHRGEDELIVNAFVEATRMARPASAQAKPLLIIAPRHPARGAAIAEAMASRRLVVFRRSNQDQLADVCDVYIADTLGELGLFYRLARLVVMGGGFAPGVGGHNPLEPARLGVAVITGLSVFNFQRTYEQMFAARAALPAEDGAALAARMADLLAHPDRARELALRAKAYCERGEQALKAAWAALTPLLPS
jgi:3-deoxy-D-manno-octulosonic-acid transferase